eukprot:TRINITY_DN10326_c0_g1_i1.p1 TRINITY_DN10326_c0_g1~~TRINITY_DN10326_c0_g1_i1.p1  ORF type:complete len:123 (-),score=25.53 TRINITY_DN10326_c0_g1_i1:87-455(-)
MIRRNLYQPQKEKKTKRLKTSRFGDSDESEEESEQESEEEDSEEEYDEDDDVSQSRATSVSPIDDLETKVEQILYRMKLPRSTVCWKNTFKHLMKTEEDDKSSNSKQEMDVDVDAQDTEIEG